MNTNTPNAQSRIPRPQGLTLAIRKVDHYPPQQKKKASKEIYKTIIRNYIQAGLVINGQVLTIQELGNYLNLTYKQVMVYIGRITNDLAGLLNPNQLQESYRALIYQAIGNSLTDRGLSVVQFEALNRSQIDKDGTVRYKPFVSGAVNTALENLFKANKGIMDVAKMMVPNPSLAIQNNHYHPQSNSGAQSIGTEEAMKLIYSGQKEGTVPGLTHEEIFEINGIANTPELVATIGNEPSTSPLQLKAPELDRGDRRLNTEDLTDVEEME